MDDGSLALLTHEGRPIHVHLAPVAATLTAGVPVLGLASVPAWRWIAESRPAWAFHHARSRASALLSIPTVPGRLARAETWVRVHSQHLPELILWLMDVN